MSALDIKLLRDVRRLWAQSLAIALVVAGGVASLVMAVGSFNSLEETRIAYHERMQFADVFATAKRAPRLSKYFRTFATAFVPHNDVDQVDGPEAGEKAKERYVGVGEK